MASTRRFEVAAQRRCGDLTGERRAARAGQDDPQIRPGDELARNVGGVLVGAAGDLAPRVGLLPDLENGCAAVFLGGNVRVDHWAAPVVQARAGVGAQGVADPVDDQSLRDGFEPAGADPLVLAGQELADQGQAGCRCGRGWPAGCAGPRRPRRRPSSSAAGRCSCTGGRCAARAGRPGSSPPSTWVRPASGARRPRSGSTARCAGTSSASIIASANSASRIANVRPGPTLRIAQWSSTSSRSCSGRW